MPMLVKEQWGIAKCPILALFNAYYKNAFQVVVNSLCAQTLKKHAWNYSQYLCRTKINFDRQLNPF